MVLNLADVEKELGNSVDLREDGTRRYESSSLAELKAKVEEQREATFGRIHVCDNDMAK